MIFSGSCVVEIKQYIMALPKAGQVPWLLLIPAISVLIPKTPTARCKTNIAYSLDNGLTWTKYKNNPVLDLHKKDFSRPESILVCKRQKMGNVCGKVLPHEHIVQFTFFSLI